MSIIHFGLFGLLVFSPALANAGESRWDQPTAPMAAPVEIAVHRSASCGCCRKWLQHMKQHGFRIKDIEEKDMDAVKDRLGVPPILRSCHTAVVAGYLIEGHVPAGDVKKLLGTKPGLLGLSVPGMPVGTPGMEMGGRKDAFSVIGFDQGDKTTVFTEYRAD